ncbi:MAG: DUF4437 domain-containing protein [Alphaproteobacteria bacterium]|nr:DUF4437 domain-containing protein [Alphaproteobacteria bacterium]
MSRPHCVFIQAQDLPWLEGLPGGIRPNVQSRTLSLDDADGSTTLLVRYPKGWRRGGPEYIGAAEEMLVLDGALVINGERYEQGHFAYLPAGYVRIESWSPLGAVVYTALSGPAVPLPGARPQGYDGRLLVAHVDSHKLAWTDEGVDPRFNKVPKMKRLRTDPYTRETSFLFTMPGPRVPVGQPPRPQLTHSMIEEIFCIEGDNIWGDAGWMGPGGYAWWREREYHGPNGTHGGFVLYVRTINGPLENFFDGPKRSLAVPHPPYTPRLPDSMRAWARPWDQSTKTPF